MIAISASFSLIMYLKIKNTYRQYVFFISRVTFLYVYTRLSWLTWVKTRRYVKSEAKKNYAQRIMSITHE